MTSGLRPLKICHLASDSHSCFLRSNLAFKDLDILQVQTGDIFAIILLNLMKFETIDPLEEPINLCQIIQWKIQEQNLLFEETASINKLPISWNQRNQLIFMAVSMETINCV